jgi:hypothetical protein
MLRRRALLTRGWGRSRPFVADLTVGVVCTRGSSGGRGREPALWTWSTGAWCTVHLAKGYVSSFVDLGAGGPGGLQAGTRRWTAAPGATSPENGRNFASARKNGFPATKLDAKSTYRELGRRRTRLRVLGGGSGNGWTAPWKGAARPTLACGCRCYVSGRRKAREGRGSHHVVKVWTKERVVEGRRGERSKVTVQLGRRSGKKKRGLRGAARSGGGLK